MLRKEGDTILPNDTSLLQSVGATGSRTYLSCASGICEGENSVTETQRCLSVHTNIAHKYFYSYPSNA